MSMNMSSTSAAVFVFCFLFILPVRGQVSQCGKTYYNPSMYTCYNETTGELCPITQSGTTFPCGGACYHPSAYSCVNGSLGPPVTSSLFTITVSAPLMLEDQLPLEALGSVAAEGTWGGFAVGPGITGPETYCPLSPASSCPPGTQTVFDGAYGTTVMDTEVPGGQTVYIAANGALSVSTPHSARYPPGAILSGYGPSGGELVFTGPGGSGWLGCPVPPGDFSPPLKNILQIFANISTHPTGCTAVTLLLNKYTGGYGAWQYD